MGLEAGVTTNVNAEAVPKRVLVTGGAGFIGSRLAKYFTSLGASVHCYDNLLPQVHGPDTVATIAAFEPTGAELTIGAIENASKLRACIEKFNPELIFHLASDTGTGQSYDEPARYSLVNTVGTSNLIEAVRACNPALRRVVLASSRSIYGEGAGKRSDGVIVNAEPRTPVDLRNGIFGIKDRDGNTLEPVPTPECLPPMPASIYASTKLMQEYLLCQGLAGTQATVAVLRLQNVYGPGQSLKNPYTGVISIFSQLIMKGNKLNIFEDGDIVRDFVYVDDVVRALALAGTAAKPPSGPINVGSGEKTSILAMAKALLKLLNRDPENHFISGDYRIGDVRYAVGDIGAARTSLAWSPTVDFSEGLKRFVAWSVAGG